MLVSHHDGLGVYQSRSSGGVPSVPASTRIFGVKDRPSEDSNNRPTKIDDDNGNCSGGSVLLSKTLRV